MAKTVAAPHLEEEPACRLQQVEAETEAVTEAETEAVAEAGPLDLKEDQAATGPPEWEEGLAGHAHEVASNASTVPSTLSKAVCDRNESTHPTESLKSFLACGHNIPQLGI